MGQIRARTDEDIAARKKEILDVTAKLLKKYEYEDLTLAIIADKLSISRPSLYNYYKTKEEIYLDLMRREYLSWAKELGRTFKERMTREQFCRSLTRSLIKRQLIMQLFTVQQTKLLAECGKDAILQYNRDIHPFFEQLTDILRSQFPDCTDEQRDMFKVQLTLYCYSIYPFTNMPSVYAKKVAPMNLYGDVPPSEDVIFKGLMLLSRELE